MLERQLEMKASPKPHITAIHIEPGNSALLLNRQFILANTTAPDRMPDLIVCYPSSSVVFRDDPKKPDGIRDGSLNLPQRDFHVAIEFTYRGNHVYIDDQFEIIFRGLGSFYSVYDLLSAKPVDIETINGRLDFRNYLRGIAIAPKSL